MNKRSNKGTIRLNKLLCHILMLLTIILAGLLYARFRSMDKTMETVTEATGSAESAAETAMGIEAVGEATGSAELAAETAVGIEAVAEAPGSADTATIELFGKTLDEDYFQELAWDEDVVYTVMSSYYNEKSGGDKEYGNLHTWSQEGVTDGSYFVYAAYEVMLEGIDTPVPSLSWAYLQTGEDGGLYFSDVSGNGTVQELVDSVRSSEEGQELIKLAQEAYDEAVEGDDALAQYMKTYRQTNAQQKAGAA